MINFKRHAQAEENMDEEEAPFDLKKYIACPVCENELKVLISLPCLDNVCMECLRREHELQRQQQEERRTAVRQENRNHNPVDDQPPLGDPPSGEQQDLGSNQGHQNGEEDGSSIMENTIESVIPKVNLVHSDEHLRSSFDSKFFCCPLKYCQAVTNIPLDNINELENLNINTPLQNIRRTMIIKKDLPKGKVLCDHCGNVAVGLCYNKECSNRPFCGNCLKYHLRDKKTHAIAYPDDDDDHFELESSDRQRRRHNESDTKISWKDLKQSDILCEEEDHERYCRNLYCIDHDEVICRACTWVNSLHRRCDRIESTRVVYDHWVGVTNEKLNVVEEMDTHFKAAIATTQEMKRALADKVEMVKALVTDRYTNLKQKLESQQNELLSQCEVLLDHKTNELDNHLGMLNRITATFKRHIETVQWLKNTTIPSEFMILKTQINQRSNQLVSEYSNYQCEPIEDDCIFFEENTSFNISNAIGRVYSTPSVKHFKLKPVTEEHRANQLSYFAVVTHDALSNQLISSYLPNLCATIRHVNEHQIATAYVNYDKQTGQYYITISPNRSGQHELCVYQPLRRPYNKRYVGQTRYRISVGEEMFLYPFPS